jgi:hypothetical protein
LKLRRETFCTYWCQILPLIRPGNISIIDSNLLSWAVRLVAGKKLVGLVILGQCHNNYGINQPEKTILKCSKISNDHFYISFVHFYRKMKY